jgi:hypothetical protein
VQVTSFAFFDDIDISKLRAGETKPPLVPWDPFPVPEKQSDEALQRYTQGQTQRQQAWSSGTGSDDESAFMIGLDIVTDGPKQNDGTMTQVSDAAVHVYAR